MSYYSVSKSGIEQLNTVTESNHQFFSTNDKGETLECRKKPIYKRFFSEFEIKDYQEGLGIFTSDFFLLTGELENGLLFLQAPNPRMTNHFIEHCPEFSCIAWIGDTKPSIMGVDNGLNFYSFYTGESFSKVIKVFKKVNAQTPLAGEIEDLMKHEKVYL